MKPELAAPPRHEPTPGWGQSLATGAPGVSLLHIVCARAGAGGWDTAHQWAVAMTRAPVNAHPDDCGLYRGAPAVAFALHTAGRRSYATALTTLDSHIAALTRRRLAQAHERIDCGQLPQFREFDLITGLTGLGVYLLYRYGDGELFREVLAYLVRFTEPLRVDGTDLPGWWCADSPAKNSSRRFRSGHGNFGMAHGIAGPLALLALAMRRNIIVTGQARAVGRICAWLDQWRIGRGPGAWWPETISLSEWRDGTIRQSGPGRPSWCYGTPGLARAQQVAAIALADPYRQRLAEEALAGCVADEAQLSGLRDASLCHGWAGVVQTTWRAASEADDRGALASRLPGLLARLEQHLERNGPPVHEGLLEGTAGVRLAQHTTTMPALAEPRWDACLLLS